MDPAGLGLRPDSRPSPRVFCLLELLGPPAGGGGGGWRFGEFGDFNLCSPLLFGDASSEERDKDGILLFCPLSPGDITAVARELADLPVLAGTAPFPLLLAPCSSKLSAAWRGEARLRLKFGSAAHLLLGSVNSASSGIRCCGWTRSFPRSDRLGGVSMATGGKALVGQRERV